MTLISRTLLLAAILAVATAIVSPAAAASTATPALAATAAAAAPAAEPQSTTATYGDWTLRCAVPPKPATDAAGAAPPYGKLCEIDQAIQVKGQAGPIAQIAVGPDPKTGTMRLVVQLPAGVWLPAGVKVNLGADTTSLSFKRCIGGACLADIDLSDAMASDMKTGKDAGKLTFQANAGTDAALPLSLSGFAAAFDALDKAR